MKEHARKARFFDKRSEEWAQLGFDEKAKEKIRWMLRRTGIRRGMTVVEPGCGAGRLTAWLSRLVGEDGRVVAVDISPRMLEKAKELVRASNVTFRLSAAEKLRVRRASADVVLCFNAFPHFDDKRGALRRFKTILKPDGKLVLIHLMGSKRVNELHRSVGAAVGHDMIPDAQRMELMFRAEGFRIDELIDEEERYYLIARHATPQPTGRKVPLVVGIVASPREGGNTDILVERVLDGARSAGAKTVKFVIDSMQINPCKSCFRCFEVGRCVQRDEMKQIYRVLPRASAMVFGSPIYLNYLSAQAKLFIDRLYPFIVKNPKAVSLRGMKGVLVVTQGNPDQRKYEDVSSHLRRLLLHFFGIDARALIRQCGNFHRVTVLSEPRLLRRAMTVGGSIV